MIIHNTPLPDLSVAISEPREDERGLFSRLFCTDELASILKTRTIRQINYSKTTLSGTVRGLHFQYPPFAEMKLVRCLHGRVFDVAVDLRRLSSHYLQWYAIELSPDAHNMMIIPEGFAHGFQALEPNSEILYFVTAIYNANTEDGLNYSDPKLAIHWPLEISNISVRDNNRPFITKDFAGISL